MASVSVRGASLDFVERGDGDPLVLVHGSASDRRTLQRQVETLGAHTRAIAYSRRYHWPNAPIAPGADYSMSEHVDDLEAVLGALDAAPAHLVGHSYGAFVCLLLAIRRPDLVRTLALAEPPVVTLFVGNPPKPSEIAKLIASRPRTAIALLRFGATGVAPAAKAAKRGDLAAVTEIFGAAVLGRAFFNRLSDARLEQARINTFAAELLGSGFAPLAADEVRAIRVPVLLINGEHSPTLFRRLTDALEELLPSSERVEIAAASHMMHEDDPAAFDAAVLDFVRRRG